MLVLMCVSCHLSYKPSAVMKFKHRSSGGLTRRSARRPNTLLNQSRALDVPLKDSASCLSFLVISEAKRPRVMSPPPAPLNGDVSILANCN